MKSNVRNRVSNEVSQCSSIEVSNEVSQCNSNEVLNKVSKCNSFVYNRGALSNFTTISGGQWETAVTELDLVCTDSWKNTLITVSTFIGFMLGSIVGGNYCDNFGRKNGITVFSFLLGTTLIIHGVVPVNYWIFAILRILESLFLCTVHKSKYLLC